MRLTPRDLHDLTEIIDGRVRRVMSRQPRTTYGTVDAVTGDTASVFIEGSANASTGLRIPATFGVASGDFVRVVIHPDGDRWIAENLSAHRPGDADDVTVGGISLPRGVRGYVSSSTAQSGISTETDLTGLSVSVTVPAGRLIRVRAKVFAHPNGVGKAILRVFADAAEVAQEQHRFDSSGGSGNRSHVNVTGFHAPSSGTYTYKATLEFSGTSIDTVSDVDPGWLLIEDIGAA